MSIGGAAALLLTMLFLAFVPGPTEIAVVARSVSSGRSHGLAMIGGIVTADFLFIVAAVAGLSATAAALGPLFVVVQVLAGLVLMVLGLAQLRSRPELAQATARPATVWAASFSSGFLLTLGDPKAIVGYMSLLPAFVDLSEVSPADVLAIMFLAAVAVFTGKVSYILLGERAIFLLGSKESTGFLKKAAGVILLAVGSVLTLRACFAFSGRLS